MSESSKTGYTILTIKKEGINREGTIYLCSDCTNKLIDWINTSYYKTESKAEDENNE